MEHHGKLVKIVVVELIVLFFLGFMGIRIASSFNAIAILLLLIPVELLLLSVSRLPDKPPFLRGICKIAFWWLIICYVAITVLKLTAAFGL